MGSGPETGTWVTLLGRLHRSPDDPAAWVEFVAYYGRKIHAWCRGWGLQDADAQDVTQVVLLKLATKLREFEYDPARSFRAWLKTVTHHAWRDQSEATARHRSGERAALAVLDAAEARQSLAQCLEETFDQELLKEAMARVQLRVEPRTWEAFRLLAVENWSGADAAKHLGMKVATAFVARSKVQRMLRAEVARLEGG